MNKEQYIREIVEMLNKTKDTKLVDFIYKLLKKTA